MTDKILRFVTLFFALGPATAFAQDSESVSAGVGLIVFLVFALVLLFLLIIPMWKIFTKAGKPGWASIIPIYNQIVLIQIANKPIWWILLFFIPFVNLIFVIIVTHRLSLAFGKDVGFTVGLFLLPFIFLPILGYGDAKYVGFPNEPLA